MAPLPVRLAACDDRALPRPNATEALPPSRRRPDSVPRNRHRSSPCAACIPGPVAPRVGADRAPSSPRASGSCCRTCRSTATPRTGRAIRTRRTGSTEVIAGFCREVAGPRPLLAGHDIGAELALQSGHERAAGPGSAGADAQPTAPTRRVRRQAGGVARGLSRRGAARLRPALAHGAKLVFRPSMGERLSVQRNPAARDLVRHAFADVAGNGNRARSWAKFARRWPVEAAAPAARRLPADRLPGPVAVGRRGPGASADRRLRGARPAAERQLRTLPGTGFLMAYDDPVGVARELISFFG